MGTQQDLRKLGRGDLLDILLEQNKELDALNQAVKLQQLQLAENDEQIGRLKARLDAKDEQMERLKAKLTAKDAQIERLKSKLDVKDAEIAHMQAVDLDNPGTLAAAAIKASGILQAAEQAASQYLEGARQIEVRRRELYNATMRRCQEAEQKLGIK